MPQVKNSSSLVKADVDNVDHPEVRNQMLSHELSRVIPRSVCGLRPILFASARTGNLANDVTNSKYYRAWE